MGTAVESRGCELGMSLLVRDCEVFKKYVLEASSAAWGCLDCDSSIIITSQIRPSIQCLEP